jgi:hypothetical protein
MTLERKVFDSPFRTTNLGPINPLISRQVSWVPLALSGFVLGHDLSRAVKAANDEGFSPCGTSFPILHGELHDSSGSHCSNALYQGTTLVGPHKPNKVEGFSPCGSCVLVRKVN